MVIEYSLYEVVGLSTQVIRTTERSEGERRRARVAPPGHLSYLRMMIGMIKAVTDRESYSGARHNLYWYNNVQEGLNTDIAVIYQ